MKVTDFDFSLPETFIAKEPVEPRDRCRLLVLDIKGRIEDRFFFDLPDYLEKGDLLLLNNTKVLPARLTGRKKTGGRVEFLLVKETEPLTWEILCRDRFTGYLYISEGFSAYIKDGKTAVFEYAGNLIDKLWEIGDMPLPPYIKRRPDKRDRDWYQTVFAERIGSIAAPTAGIHFTPELIKKIRSKGVLIGFVTLHVGKGTFKSVKVEDVKDHKMDPEYFEIRRDVIRAIEETKAAHKRVFAVGTTTTRAVEGLFTSNCRESSNGMVKGVTDIFIYPGYNFKVIDALITNFHLPRSTPLFLTGAFCGRDNLMKAYRFAISKGYRFFSYGDAMLILR
ncbi:MAG: tRNA preQ1(34) S-adenosylmethionine ribosyltransferase-isomerase QueA [Thermodesulfovibrionales bacterium]